MHRTQVVLVYTYKPPVSVPGMSVTAHRPRAADRISRLTGARHARGHDPAPRMARRLASGGRRTAPVACARSANIHDLHLRDALAMRAANVRAALARGANPAHACRSPLSNAGAWRDYFFAPRRTPRGSRAAVAARDRRPVDGAMRLCRHCSSHCWRAALPPPHRCRYGQGPGVGGRGRGGRVGAEERPEGVVPKGSWGTEGQGEQQLRALCVHRPQAVALHVSGV